MFNALRTFEHRRDRAKGRIECDPVGKPDAMASEQAYESLSLELPVSPLGVSMGRRAATRFAQEQGVDDTTLWDLRLAVSEALTNAVIHADQQDGHVELRAEATARRLTLEIIDHGTGMRARTDSPGLGLGLKLMREAADELQIEDVDAGGTSVQLHFFR